MQIEPQAFSRDLPTKDCGCLSATVVAGNGASRSCDSNEAKTQNIVTFFSYGNALECHDHSVDFQIMLRMSVSLTFPLRMLLDCLPQPTL